MEQQTLRELHRALNSILDLFNKGALPANSYGEQPGICVYLATLAPVYNDERRALLGDLFLAWPETSGDSCYPVASSRYNARVAYNLFSRHRWDQSTEYGRARLRLLKWLIGETGRLLEGGDNA